MERQPLVSAMCFDHCPFPRHCTRMIATLTLAPPLDTIVAGSSEESSDPPVEATSELAKMLWNILLFTKMVTDKKRPYYIHVTLHLQVRNKQQQPCSYLPLYRTTTTNEPVGGGGARSKEKKQVCSCQVVVRASERRERVATSMF
jgi:hypothetical protein